jgi:ketosteroid isomerase-like protein
MSAPDLRFVDDWEAANNELDEHLVAAMANKDVEGLMSCFVDSPDLIAVIWGKELRGSDQMRQAVIGLFSEYDAISLRIDRISKVRSGEVVFAVGEATYTFRKGGDETQVREIWTDVRKKVNGRWVDVLDHAEVLPS